ncbi:hypothetical protein Tco_1349822 [Tanacetum coccineum]
MSNTNTNLQTQTSNALHNAIMEAYGKDHPPMLAPGNYVQWKFRIKRYIDTKPNNELIHYCLQNPPYKFKWTEKTVPVAEGSSETTTEGSQPAATKNKGKAVVNSPQLTYDQEPEMVAEDDALLKEKEIDKRMDLIFLSFKKIYKPTNNNLRTLSNPSRENQDNSPRINIGTGECQKPKWAKDATYHKEKMLLCKQEEAGFQLNAEQADWRDDTDDEPDNQELEAHYMYMAQIQEVTPDDADNSGPIFDAEPLQKVQNNDDNYNVFAIESKHPEQPEYVDDTYPVEQDKHNIIIDSLDMSYDREHDDQDDNDDLAKERDLFASLIAKLKCEIDAVKTVTIF